MSVARSPVGSLDVGEPQSGFKIQPTPGVIKLRALVAHGRIVTRRVADWNPAARRRRETPRWTLARFVERVPLSAMPLKVGSVGDEGECRVGVA
jgi:hypothetical protein